MAIKPQKPGKKNEKREKAPAKAEARKTRQSLNKNESRQTKGWTENRNESRQTKGFTNRNESRQTKSTSLQHNISLARS